MKKSLGLIALSLLFSVFSPLQAQTFDWRLHFTQFARLGSYYMPSFGDGDSMTEPFWLSGGTSPGYGDTDGFRDTWYIPAENLTDTAPLYRLFNPSHGNHLDAWVTSGGGYSYEITHGYPWTYQRSGTKPITRYLKSSIFDHRTWLNSATPSGYSVDAVLDTAGGVPRYGYERFGNKIDRASVLADAYDPATKLETTSLKVEFNKIWGNAIGKITYTLPNSQTVQIVDEDLGAMVQSTLFVGTSADPSGTCCLVNPTEAGGVDFSNYGNTKAWAGSPIISTTTASGNSRQTVVRPANFPGVVFSDNDVRNPLLWNGLFRKTVSAGYTAGATTHPDVIKIVFEARLATDAPTGMAAAYTNVGMNNTFWLWSDPISTDVAHLRIEERNLATNAVASDRPVPDFFDDSDDPWLCNADISGVGACSAHRGYIAYSDNNSTLAYGVMRKDGTSDAPHAFKIMNWCNGGNSDCSVGTPELVFDVYKNRAITSSYQSETVFLVVGTLANVRTRLRQIYCQETGACTP